MAINSKLDISPEAYNQIGKNAFDSRINQIMNTSSNVSTQVGEGYIENVPEGQRENFRTRLEEIKNLPVDQQKDATRQLLRDFRVEAQDFETNWDKARANLNKEFDKMFEDIGRAGTRPEQRQDFDRLKELSQKKIDGTITPEETIELNEKREQCAKHRKEYLFSSSKRDLPENTKENEREYNRQKEEFKKDINTFTNAKNERLCYRITVEEVKQRLIDATGQQIFEDYEVNGQRIFQNMKLNDFDRIDRVLTPLGSRGNDILRASLAVANDPNFQGNPNSPNDIMSIAEAMNLEDVNN
jgi:hypothetical protein